MKKPPTAAALNDSTSHPASAKVGRVELLCIVVAASCDEPWQRQSLVSKMEFLEIIAGTCSYTRSSMPAYADTRRCI